MKIRFIIQALLTLILTSQAVAQDPVSRIWNEVDSINQINYSNAMMPSVSPWSINTSVGTQFITNPLTGPMMNVFVSPHLNYSATNRLAFHGGLIGSHMVPLQFLGAESEFEIQPFSQMSMFVAASYRLTENLVVHGAGVKQVYLSPVGMNLQGMNFDDISFGATYHFGSFSIGASVHRSSGSYLQNPFNIGGTTFGTPYYW